MLWQGKRSFLSTQYSRHASRTYYTPEPDVMLVDLAAWVTSGRWRRPA